MKNIFSFCIVALFLYMINCQAQESGNDDKSVSNTDTDPFDFTWIKSSEEIKLATANIYFHGKSEGKYLDKEKWTGKIIGDIFFQPKACKSLSQGLYLQNFSVQVNEDSSINVLDPEQSPFLKSKKVIFENGKVVITYDNREPIIFETGRFLNQLHRNKPKSSSYDTFQSEVLKVFFATDRNAVYRTYLVKWKGQEVIASDLLGTSEYSIGDTISVLVSNHPHPNGEDKPRHLSFQVLPKR